MEPETNRRAPTGILGLDEILGGGLPAHGLYLVKGEPGTGKSTLAMQFLNEGVRRGEPAVYITLSESEANIRESSRSHGWSLEGIALHELVVEHGAAEEEQYTLFHPTEIELAELTRRILATFADMKAPRVVVDSLSEIRLLSGDPLRYRRHILALARQFAAQQATVLVLDEGNNASPADLQVESLARGVLQLEYTWPTLGDVRRRLRVLKVRGLSFRGGNHDFTIEKGGLAIYPRLRVADHKADFAHGVVSTGLGELDALLGGGLDRGSATLLVGPSGSGKSVVTSQLAVAAAKRGEVVEIFNFDEVWDATLVRADGLKLGLREQVRSGRIRARQVDPGELAPWQFVRLVLDAAETGKASLIVIDSINGYLTAMPDERSLDLALHELFGCLSQLGVVVVATLVQHGLLGEPRRLPVDISYLSDTVLLFSTFEVRGEVRKAISVIKRRRGVHAHTIRAFDIGPTGVHIGQPLHELEGVLTGAPTSLGSPSGPRKDDEPGEG